MAFLWIKNPDAANDAVQEAFSKAWLNIGSLQRMENPTGWMVRTLKNQVLQQLKEAKRMDSLEKVEVPVQETEEGSIAETPSMKKVFSFLEDLPEKQREVFQLREVEGLTYEEIADYMEISQEQVKVSLHRARRKLREFFIKSKIDER